MTQSIQSLVAALNSVMLGKEEQIKLALSCLLAGGHLLVEDLPGMGKTTLAHALAKVLGLHYQRVQFTSDLLPSDVLGTSIYDAKRADFVFRKGPVFSQLLLADEINRATPKTQGALLEAMEERQVSVDGAAMPLPSPFFVIATQNPVSQLGTYPLPESQLDRFLMRISLGYPDPNDERRLLQGFNPRQDIEGLAPSIDTVGLAGLRERALEVHVSSAIVDYIQNILAYSRESKDFSYGLSPRAGMGLVAAGRAFAFVSGRDHVVPEDIQSVLGPVVEHRLAGAVDITGHEGQRLSDRILKNVDVLAVKQR